MKKNIFIALFMVLYSGLAKADVFGPLVSFYADSKTGASIKVGAAYQFDGSFPYVNFEYGTKARKAAVGYAIESGPGIYTRFGFSYVKTDVSSLYGVESTVTMLVWSLRAGIYQNTNTDNQHLSLGVGFGF